MAAVVMVCRDLMFPSMVGAGVRERGLAMKTCVGPASLPKVVTPETRYVLLDLALPGLTPADMTAVKEAAPPGAVVVAFGSHVDAEGLRAARAAGCDLALPRSEFMRRWPEMLAALPAPPPAAGPTENA